MKWYLIEVIPVTNLAQVMYVLITGLVSRLLVRVFDCNLILNPSQLAKLFGEAWPGCVITIVII